MSDIALINIKERSNSVEQKQENMPGLDINVAPKDNGGFDVDPHNPSKNHEKKESVGGDRASGYGAISVSSEDTLIDFGLHQAAREGAVEALKTKLQKVVEEGQDVERVIEYKDAEGFTPLHHAAKSNRKDALLLLLDNGAYLDARGEDLNTPLHLAAKYSQFIFYKLFIIAVCLSLGFVKGYIHICYHHASTVAFKQSPNKQIWKEVEEKLPLCFAHSIKSYLKNLPIQLDLQNCGQVVTHVDQLLSYQQINLFYTKNLNILIQRNLL